MRAMSASLQRIASYVIKKPHFPTHTFSLVISRGSVVDFDYPRNPRKAAIVNAANERCLGGGGVDGAISEAGGPNLYDDRFALPIVVGTHDVRCPTGEARLTGPNTYSNLKVSNVIHAVGPNYLNYENDLSRGDELLCSAYTNSLKQAEETKLEALAFSLLSSGIFRGSKSKSEVLSIGMKAIIDFDGYDELNEVHMCAYSANEADDLKKIAKFFGLR